MRLLQHHVTPDHTQEKNLTIYALASGTNNITKPAITEAIVPFRIDLKELSLMLLPELGVNGCRTTVLVTLQAFIKLGRRRSNLGESVKNAAWMAVQI
ncbi:hypothetical protein [Pseudomonas sp.]|uniref:hypothetical protein n=1 Tax=Pseudomonas sp. TaxID=306 RepID=UPI003D6DC1D7